MLNLGGRQKIKRAASTGHVQMMARLELRARSGDVRARWLRIKRVEAQGQAHAALLLPAACREESGPVRMVQEQAARTRAEKVAEARRHCNGYAAKMLRNEANA